MIVYLMIPAVYILIKIIKVCCKRQKIKSIDDDRFNSLNDKFDDL